MTKQDIRFVSELDRQILWQRTNQNDPYGVGVSVIVALEAVRAAFIVSRGGPKSEAQKVQEFMREQNNL